VSERGIKYTVKFCSECNIWQEPLTEHCVWCNVCVPLIDHHCPWMGTCVSAANIRFFSFFLFFGGIGFMCTAVATLQAVSTLLYQGTAIASWQWALYLGLLFCPCPPIGALCASGMVCGVGVLFTGFCQAHKDPRMSKDPQTWFREVWWSEYCAAPVHCRPFPCCPGQPQALAPVRNSAILQTCTNKTQLGDVDDELSGEGYADDVNL